MNFTRKLDVYESIQIGMVSNSIEINTIHIVIERKYQEYVFEDTTIRDRTQKMIISLSEKSRELLLENLENGILSKEMLLDVISNSDSIEGICKISLPVFFEIDEVQFPTDLEVSKIHYIRDFQDKWVKIGNRFFKIPVDELENQYDDDDPHFYI